MSEEIQKMKYVKAVKFLTELGHIDSLINQIEEDYQNTCCLLYTSDAADE